MHHVREEHGGSIITVLALTGAAMFCILALLDVFGIYLAKRAGQAAADAAALGALQAAQQAFNEAAAPALADKLSALQAAVASDVAQRMSSWESSRRAALTASLQAQTPPPSDDEIAQIVNAAIAQERPGVYTATRQGAIRSRIADAEVAQDLISGVTVPLASGLRALFTQAERGCLVRRAGARDSGALQDAARWYATQNGANGDVSVTFPYEAQVKVRVVVSMPVPLGLTARFAPRGGSLLKVEATARAGETSGLTFDLSGSC